MAVYNLFADSVMQIGRGEVRRTKTWSFETSAEGQEEEMLLKEQSGRWERVRACQHKHPHQQLIWLMMESSLLNVNPDLFITKLSKNLLQQLLGIEMRRAGWCYPKVPRPGVEQTWWTLSASCFVSQTPSIWAGILLT